MIRCPKCGHIIRARALARALGAAGGASGRGAAKRRPIDYAALGRAGAAAKRRQRKAAKP